MLSDMQVDRIVDNIMSTGGATFNASGLFSYMRGYQVGLHGETFKLRDGLDAEATRAILDNKVRQFAQRKWALLEEGFDFGAWVDPDGILCLDVTRHYSDCELALKRGEEFGQDAIWDWSTMEEISVKLMDKLSFTR